MLPVSLSIFGRVHVIVWVIIYLMGIVVLCCDAYNCVVDNCILWAEYCILWTDACDSIGEYLYMCVCLF